MALTKRERVMRTVRFEETDRTPCYDILENDAIIEHYAGQKLTPQNGREVKGLAIGRVLDMTRMPYGPWEPGQYQRDDGLVIQQERWTAWIVERPFHDLPTLIDWVKDEIRRTEALVRDQAYAEETHAEIRDLQRIFARGDPTGRDDPTVLVLESGVGLTEMYWAAGMELFAYLTADEPDLVEAWLEARLRAELRRVAAIADPRLIPIALTYDDIAYKSGLLFSPRWLRRLWVPRLERLVAAWHARDTICLFHSDGNLWSILDDLVGAGIDGLNPLEVLAGMSVAAVRERYPELFLTGGIDVSQLLPYGTPEEVRAVCRKTIADAGGVGYFLGSTTELHWDVKLENAVAMFDVAHEGANENPAADADNGGET
ncbi:MAG: uroporphyrinogen decarboxylase family protein [Anaerolineae bacterium]